MPRENGEIRRFPGDLPWRGGNWNFNLDSVVLDKWNFFPHYLINYLKSKLIFFFSFRKEVIISLNSKIGVKAPVIS